MAVTSLRGAPTTRLSFGRLAAINAFWFGGGAHWQPIYISLIPVGATLIAGSNADLLIGRVTAAGIGLCAVAAQSTKATAAEAALVGQIPADDVIAEVARLAAQAAEPKADIRGSAEYKRDVARVFVQRGLRTAIDRAQGVAA